MCKALRRPSRELWSHRQYRGHPCMPALMGCWKAFDPTFEDAGERAGEYRGGFFHVGDHRGRPPRCSWRRQLHHRGARCARACVPLRQSATHLDESMSHTIALISLALSGNDAVLCRHPPHHDPKRDGGMGRVVASHRRLPPGDHRSGLCGHRERNGSEPPAGAHRLLDAAQPRRCAPPRPCGLQRSTGSVAPERQAQSVVCKGRSRGHLIGLL